MLWDSNFLLVLPGKYPTSPPNKKLLTGSPSCALHLTLLFIKWYFIRQDPYNGQWNTEKLVPTFYGLGRDRIHPSTLQAADVDSSQAQKGQIHRTQPSNITIQAGMATTMTVAGTSATMATLTLANTTVPTGKLATFISRPCTGGGGGNPPGGGPPGGGFGGLPPAGPPGGGGPPGGPPPAGPPGGSTAAPGGGGNGKLGGNPPSEFDGDRSKANTFRNQFNLYRITNIDAEQMTNPMK